jgi:hypothetical protein
METFGYMLLAGFIVGAIGLIFKMINPELPKGERDAINRIAGPGAYSTPIEPVLGDIDAIVIPERDPADPDFDAKWPEDITLEAFNSQVEYYTNGNDRDDAK